MVPRWLDLPVSSVAPESTLGQALPELLGAPAIVMGSICVRSPPSPPFPLRVGYIFYMLVGMENPPHPLASLSIEETNAARDVVVSCHPDTVIGFRTISLQEPAKTEMIDFLELEHSANPTSNPPRPRRLAKASYDVIDKSKVSKYMESIVDVESKERVSTELISDDVHACLTV